MDSRSLFDKLAAAKFGRSFVLLFLSRQSLLCLTMSHRQIRLVLVLPLVRADMCGLVSKALKRPRNYLSTELGIKVNATLKIFFVMNEEAWKIVPLLVQR